MASVIALFVGFLLSVFFLYKGGKARETSLQYANFALGIGLLYVAKFECLAEPGTVTLYSGLLRIGLASFGGLLILLAITKKSDGGAGWIRIIIALIACLAQASTGFHLFKVSELPTLPLQAQSPENYSLSLPARFQPSKVPKAKQAWKAGWPVPALVTIGRVKKVKSRRQLENMVDDLLSKSAGTLQQRKSDGGKTENGFEFYSVSGLSGPKIRGKRCIAIRAIFDEKTKTGHIMAAEGKAMGLSKLSTQFDATALLRELRPVTASFDLTEK